MNRLLGYVSATEAVNDLRGWLQTQLPAHMVPAHITVMDELPLNNSGKVNRKALPRPEIEVASPPPITGNRLEQQMVVIWQQLLQVERVGLNDSFFEIGGHSLLLTELKNRLDDILDKPVTLVNLFQYPTIAGLAAFVGDEIALESRVEKQAVISTEDIAIVGMAGRFPGADDVEQYWGNIRDGVSGIYRYSDAELLEQGLDPELIGDSDYVKAGGRLADTDKFDGKFFGYTPNEALVIDPQQRLLLETAWHAVENAGLDVQRLDGAMAVFAGVGLQTYYDRYVKPNPDVMARLGDYQLMLANDKDFVATRIAYKLGLRGPAMSVQTACSTSLVAVHMACQSLRMGECDFALAGGAGVGFPQQGYLYKPGMIVSPDGHCRAFDEHAEGTVVGGGVAAVVLARMSEAKTRRLPIQAVIVGSAINNDGDDKVGFTAPGVNGQAQVINAAIGQLDAESISYVEAHGTATPMGDPIEVAALTQAYRRHTDKSGYCAMGSVKSNIGHLDVAAGLAGMIKTVQALKHQQLPPSLDFNKPNPAIDFANSPFYVNQQLTDWQGPQPLRAGVSSFGIGGTNAHVVLERAPDGEPVDPEQNGWQLLCLSAKTDSALNRMADNLTAFVDANAQLNLADVAYTLQLGRRQFEHRRYMLCNGEDRQVVPGKSTQVTDDTPGVVFMFPGQGSQYINMAADLYREQPPFKAVVDECAELLRPELNLDIRTLLYPEGQDGDAEALRPTQLAQPALFVVEYALARLLQSFGIEPQVMMGHSLGEYVAACLAGVFSLHDALKLVAARGRLMQSMASGEMLGVGLSIEQVEALLAELGEGGPVVAAQNAPEQCVVSGTAEQIARFEQLLESKDITAPARRLNTSHAFHSPMMQPMLAEFAERFEGVELSPPKVRCISNLTGDWLTNKQATSAQYWCDHLLNAVRFNDGVATVLKDLPEAVMIEVGPGRALAGMVRKHGKTEVVNSMRVADAEQSDQGFLLGALGQMWLHNVTIDWAQLYDGQTRSRLSLPGYSFEKTVHWLPLPGHQVADIASGELARVIAHSYHEHKDETDLDSLLTMNQKRFCSSNTTGGGSEHQSGDQAIAGGRKEID